MNPSQEFDIKDLKPKHPIELKIAPYDGHSFDVPLCAEALNTYLFTFTALVPTDRGKIIVFQRSRETFQPLRQEIRQVARVMLLTTWTTYLVYTLCEAYITIV